MRQIQGGPGKRNWEALAGSKLGQTGRILSGKLGLGVVPIRGEGRACGSSSCLRTWGRRKARDSRIAVLSLPLFSFFEDFYVFVRERDRNRENASRGRERSRLTR